MPKLPSDLRTAVRLASAVLAAIVLTGCATGKTVSDPADIVDDGKKNSMMMSYDIDLFVTDKLPKVTSTRLTLRCGTPSKLGQVPVCFTVEVPLLGRVEKDGLSLYKFSTQGASLIQMPYGIYNIESVEHTVIVDTVYKNVCTRDRLGKLTCRNQKSDITTRHNSDTPSVRAFQVDPGAGCYAGHMSVEMLHDALNVYDIDQSASVPSEEIFQRLPEKFLDTAKSRIQTACVPG